jgi:Fic family protein
MKLNKKKLALLHLLQQEASPLGLGQILKKLTGEPKERTVRRWLNEMAQEGLLEKKGHKRTTSYRILEQKREILGHCFTQESLPAIDYVQKPLYERNPTSYNGEWFETYQPNSSFYLPASNREQLYKAGARATNKDPAGTYAHQIFNRLLIDLSYNSSRLEGNTYSLLDTERLLLSGASAEGKLDEENVMILNHKEAIRYLVENAPRLRVDYQTICTIHYLLADGLVEPKYAGKLRDHWVKITGSTYIPYDTSERLQLQLGKIVDKASKIADVFEQSLFLLIHISYLQAFSDANKRTARLSANIPLIVQNLVPLSFNDVKRADYTSAMIAIYELQDVRPLIDLFVFSYMRTCAMYDSTVKSLGFDEIRVRYRSQRRAIIRTIIEKKLTGSQMIRFIKNQKEIPTADRIEFTKTILEDLEQIDQNRIAGLGITPEQLKLWKRTKTNS